MCLQHCLVKKNDNNIRYYQLYNLSQVFRFCGGSSSHVFVFRSILQSWLYTLEQMKGSDSSVLTEDSVKMAAHFCLPVGSEGPDGRELVDL